MAIAEELAAALRTAAREAPRPRGRGRGPRRRRLLHRRGRRDERRVPGPVTPASLFQVGSISKTFTSAAVMLLAQDGRLALEDPVARSSPSSAPPPGWTSTRSPSSARSATRPASTATISSSSREWDDLTVLRDGAPPVPAGRRATRTTTPASRSPAPSSPPSPASRSSPSSASACSAPLGMVSACFTADEAITYSVATPHWVNGDEAHVIRGMGWQPGWELGPVDRPAGRSHRFGRAPDDLVPVPVDGHRARRRRSSSAGDPGPAAHQPVVTATCIEDIAIDWFVRRIDGATAIGHGGLTAGYASDLVVVPEQDFAFVGLTNGTNGGLVNDTVRRWALRRFAGLHETDPDTGPVAARRPGPLRRPLRARLLPPHRGRGTRARDRRRHRVAARRLSTAWQPPVDPPFTCGFFAPDHAVSITSGGDAAGRPLRVRPDEGRADWLLWSGRRAPRLD